MEKVREPYGIIQPSPIASKKGTPTDEKDKGKDEALEKSLESKPHKKVVIHDEYSDQTITIRGNLSIEYRSRLIGILRKHVDAFAWTPTDMTKIPCFIAEHKEEELMVYLSAANEVVSVILLVEREGRQAPIHYVSRTLQGADINYPPMEKLALALVHTARRLRREEQETTTTKAPKNLKAEAKVWKLYTDGASNEHGSEAELNERSVDMEEVNAINKEATRTWMTPIQEYNEHGILTDDVAKARTIQEKACNYTIEEGFLY
nr:reverse transcriptase domain-containing protein [Tanacetum cinerariifolium]